MKTKREEFRYAGFDDTFPRFPVRKSELDRFKFGKRWYYEIASRDVEKTPLCLDVGCGAKPFPKARILCDISIKQNPDRRMKKLVTEGKPFVLCDGCFLPFKDKTFDFVTCFYLLEHLNNPAILLTELKRVSKHGYIQCPSWLNEIVYGEKVHKWIVIKKRNKFYVRSNNEKKFKIRFGFIFHILYRSYAWQILHAILDETFHLFTVCYKF